MSHESFAECLAELDEASLVAVLRARPDVLVEPVPRSFVQLAQRLAGVDSLVTALHTITRSELIVGQAVAALTAVASGGRAAGPRATPARVAALLAAGEQQVRSVMDGLCRRGLAWFDVDVLRLPDRLQAHWAAEIGGDRPVARIAQAVPVDELREIVAGLGVGADGMRKAELIDRFAEAMTESGAMAALVAELPPDARHRLDEFRFGYFDVHPGYGAMRLLQTDDPTGLLVRCGLLFRVHNRLELPTEVAVAAWLADRDPLTDPPEIAAAGTDAETARSSAEAAAQEALRGVTALLDDARAKPLAALKRGGVGVRERQRLANRLAIPGEDVVLWIDLAHATGLLGRTGSGYAPTERFARWREAEPGRRWAELADAWLALPHAPGSRDMDEDREVPPPLPVASLAGAIRRTVLRLARHGRSATAAAAEFDWFFPLHGYDPPQRDAKVDAALREARTLGVLAADRLTDLGEHLLSTADPGGGGDVDELARRCTPLLPEEPCSVILQSDLTAMVSGKPTTALSRLLAAAAVSEARSAAGVWRFTPASVRAALDAGWTAEELLSELKSASDHAVPQPLEYLLHDVARRHGHVRVRGARSCVVADEATVDEILHTRSLAALGFSRLAPTVLSCPGEPDDVLARLRAAGMSPVAEDAQGTVLVEARPDHEAPAGGRSRPAGRRDRVGAVELARQLAAGPSGDDARHPHAGAAVAELARFNHQLDDAELELLADAVYHQSDVVISYRDKNGSRTVRAIQPQEIHDRWIDSWCHLRNAQRDFTIANIESVSPLG